MIDLEKRAKAWDEFMDEPRDLTIGDTFNAAYAAGFLDGIASVDRVAIVREAFEKLTESPISKGGTMNIEQLKEGMTDIRKKSDAILSSEVAREFRVYKSHTFVRYMIDEEGSEYYHITIRGCSPSNYEAHRFLQKKLCEGGALEPFEITSEW